MASSFSCMARSARSSEFFSNATRSRVTADIVPVRALSVPAAKPRISPRIQMMRMATQIEKKAPLLARLEAASASESKRPRPS